MRQVVYLRAARRDLREISDYIKASNPAAAANIVREVDAAAQLLATVPSIGHRRPDVRNPAYRCHGVGPYIVVYRYDDDHLFLVRIVHGRRDFKKLFGP